MGPSVTIYCLQEITDYFEFERLCHDLMSLEGYSSIEPLGGFNDKGRDAIHVNKSDETTIFAYSVREDWRAKLAEDASKVSKHGHTCDQLVVITTASYTAGERDEAVAYIREQFGWKLELYGTERLRIFLDARFPQIKSKHPQIFPPELLAPYPKAAISAERNHLFISSAPENSVFADWLARKLTAEGYLVWYEGLNLLGGESYPDNIDEAIKFRSFRVLGLYSQDSLKNPEVMRQVTIALNVDDSQGSNTLIPLSLDRINLKQLDRVTSSLVFISFEENWAKGLQQLLKNLESSGCPKPLLRGKAIAAETFFENNVLSDQTESLFSNCLCIEKLPDIIYRFEGRSSISFDRSKQWQFMWAHRRIDSKTLLSFHQPPPQIENQCELQPAGQLFWRAFAAIDGVSTKNLVSELIRKSLIVKCREKGLQYCSRTELLYFPWETFPGNRLTFTRPDGSKTFVQVAGERTFWQPSESKKYRYYLAPAFFTVQDLFDDFVVLVRTRVRISDTAGKAFSGRTANSRRKRLCKDWWNKEWLDRLLAMCQYLAEDGKVRISQTQKEQIILTSVPLQMYAPLSINEVALVQRSYERSELLSSGDVGELSEGDSD